MDDFILVASSIDSELATAADRFSLIKYSSTIDADSLGLTENLGSIMRIDPWALVKDPPGLDHVAFTPTKRMSDNDWRFL